MFHDRVMSRSLTHGPKFAEAGSIADEALAAACDDRRRADRVPFPAEMVLIWNHDARVSHRYAVMDASDGGYRIRSALPVLEGTTGMVVRLLPCPGRSSKGLGQPVMVAWSRRMTDAQSPVGDGYELGLRLF